MQDNFGVTFDYLKQIESDTDNAIKAGWENVRVQWREMALRVLCEKCLTAEQFTVNDFRDTIKASNITISDSRAMGGLMMTAKKYGWITPIGSIPSKVGHKTHIQIWKSLIFKKTPARPIMKSRQAENMQISLIQMHENGYNDYHVIGETGNKYMVKIHRLYPEFSCTCESYKWSYDRPRSCKHIEHILKQNKIDEAFKAQRKQSTLL